MFKNVASQSVTLWAVDASTGLPKTGDAANMVFYVSKDDGSVTAISGNSGVPTECDSTNAKGDYKIAVSQTETNANKLRFSGKSSTSNVVVVPQTIYTAPANFTTLVIDSSGLADANMVKNGPSGSGTAVAAGAIPNAVAGASGGLVIAGSNAATTFATLTVTGVMTFTGNVVLSDGLTVSVPSTANRPGMDIRGNGTGAGVLFLGGATSGEGLRIVGNNTGSGVSMLGGGSGGPGLYIQSNGANTSGLLVQSASGHAAEFAATGTSRHGMIITGGNGGTSDGLKLVAGTGGVGLRADSVTVGGATTLTGTVSATGGSNDIRLGATAYNAAADALLARNVAGGSSSGRIVSEALYFLRNKWTVSAGTLTVYATDDSTSSWTATVGTTPGADPITSNDPA